MDTHDLTAVILTLALTLMAAGCEQDATSSAPEAPAPPAAEAEPTGDAGELATRSFSDLDGVAQRPLDVSDGKPNVVIFIAPDCPVSNAFVPEYNRLHDDLASKGVDLFLVHGDDRIAEDKARQHVSDFSLTAPVIIDPAHALVKHTGVTITPEAALIGPDGAIAYRGRVNNLFEDFGVKRRNITIHDLRDAVDAVLAGKPVERPRSPVVGCSIPGL